MKVIFDYSYDSLLELIQSWREPEYRISQLWNGLYKQLWNSPVLFSQFPKNLREHLEDAFIFEPLNAIKKVISKDGTTTKVLFKLVDNYEIETVLMEYDNRRTLCVSTQSGCSLGCVFCATGQMGLKRNLSSGEIVAQVLYFIRYLNGIGKRLTNVVLMGMGEPFLNYSNTLLAIERINDHRGLNFGARRFTISTVGILSKLEDFINEKRQINLAVSLHASTDETRSLLLPVAKGYEIQELINLCRKYTIETSRRITFEWAMINGVNDSSYEASTLVKLVTGMNCHVNIIPLNLTEMYTGKSSSNEKLKNFKRILDDNNINCTIRLHRGIDIGAGCGQLISKKKEKY